MNEGLENVDGIYFITPKLKLQGNQLLYLPFYGLFYQNLHFSSRKINALKR